MDAVGGQIGQESKWVGCRWLGAQLALAEAAQCTCTCSAICLHWPWLWLQSAQHLLTVQCAPVPLLDLQAGETPLYEACRQGHTAVLQLLLDRGANVDAADKARRQGCMPDCQCIDCIPTVHCMQRVAAPPALSFAALARCCLPCAALQQLH